MQFPLQFSSLTIPTGAGPGQQRITINDNNNGLIQVYNSSGRLVDSLGGANGQLLVYDGVGNIVASVASFSGTDPISGQPYKAGLATYTANTSIQFFGNFGQWRGSDGSIVTVVSGSGGPSGINFTPQTDVNGPWFDGTLNTSTTLYSGGRPSLSLTSPSSASVGSVAEIDTVGGGTGNSATQITLNATNIISVGKVQASSIVEGVVNITPVANTPTSVTVTYPALPSGLLVAYATANTSVVGTQVLGVAMNGLTTTQANVWITRTNTTVTSVWWRVVST